MFWCAVVPASLTRYLSRMNTLCCSNHGSACCGSLSGCIPRLSAHCSITALSWSNKVRCSPSTAPLLVAVWRTSPKASVNSIKTLQKRIRKQMKEGEGGRRRRRRRGPRTRRGGGPYGNPRTPVYFMSFLWLQCWNMGFERHGFACFIFHGFYVFGQPRQARASLPKGSTIICSFCGSIP